MRLIPILTVLVLATGPTHGFAEDHTGHNHPPGQGHQQAVMPPHGGILRAAGDGGLELVHDAATGSLTLYVLDRSLQPKAIPAKPLTLQVKPAGPSALIPVTLNPPSGETTSSTFSGSAETLKGLTAIDVIVRLELDGKPQRVVFSTAVPHVHREGDGHQH